MMKIQFNHLMAIVVVVLFVISSEIHAQISMESMAATSHPYHPVLLKGMSIHPTDPLQMSFIIDSGMEDLSSENLFNFAKDNIEYFMTALAIPDDSFWVNLSPYEQNRILPEVLGQTKMGHKMLRQDYLLKQLSSMLMSPKTKTGQSFWERLYKEIYEKTGHTGLSIDTFNKIWILPQSANMHIYGQDIFITKSQLKVMTEKDYLAQKVDQKQKTDNHGMEVVSAITRDIIVPAIEREINESKTFAELRQIYHAMILATWYKQNLAESFLGQMYSNKSTIDFGQSNIMDHQAIYKKYLTEFKDGITDIVREEYNLESNEIIAKRYMTGGAVFNRIPLGASSVNDPLSINGSLYEIATLIQSQADLDKVNIESISSFSQKELEFFESDFSLGFHINKYQAKYLSYIRSLINPEGKDLTVFFPGGVHRFYHAILATDANTIVIADPQESLDFQRKYIESVGGDFIEDSLLHDEFSYTRSAEVRTLIDSHVSEYSPMNPEKKYLETLKSQDISTVKTISFDFNYRGKTRKIVQYLVDAFDPDFQPPIMQEGFDVYMEVWLRSSMATGSKIFWDHYDPKIAHGLKAGGYILMDGVAEGGGVGGFSDFIKSMLAIDNLGFMDTEYRKSLYDLASSMPIFIAKKNQQLMMEEIQTLYKINKVIIEMEYQLQMETFVSEEVYNESRFFSLDQEVANGYSAHIDENTTVKVVLSENLKDQFRIMFKDSVGSIATLMSTLPENLQSDALKFLQYFSNIPIQRTKKFIIADDNFTTLGLNQSYGLLRSNSNNKEKQEDAKKKIAFILAANQSQKDILGELLKEYLTSSFGSNSVGGIHFDSRFLETNQPGNRVHFPKWNSHIGNLNRIRLEAQNMSEISAMQLRLRFGL